MKTSGKTICTQLSHLSSLDLCVARPDIQKKDPILWEVLKAAVFLDKYLADTLAREKRPLACHAGCGACCHQPIPLTLAELLAIKSFLRLAGMRQPLASSAKERGEDKGKTSSTCMFLHEDSCSIYPVRPFACRRYLVFNRPCVMGEDAASSRPQDMLISSQKILFDALCLTLPGYRLLERPTPQVVTREFFTRNTFIMHDLPLLGEKSCPGEREEEGKE